MIASRAAGARRAPDSELIARIAAGDIGALGELYDRHRDAVHHFVARATGDGHDVDDLVHAVFLTVAKSAAKYDGRPVCRPWLLGIAVRLLKRRRHSMKRWVALLSSLGNLRPGTSDPRHALDARSEIDRALAEISEAKRVALLLAEVEGLSCNEIAELLGIPVGTVWTRLHAARRELRALLAEGAES